MYQDYAFLGIAPWHKSGEYNDEDINIIKYMKRLDIQAQREMQQKARATTKATSSTTKQPIITDHNNNVVTPDPDGF